MDRYTAPVDDILASLATVGLGEVLELPPHEGLDVAAVRDVLEGFGKLAADVIAPTDAIGDRQGATFDRATGTVSVPDELAAAFHQYVDGGWSALAADPDLGGGGFPKMVGTALSEILGSANMALSLNPLLTQSAIELLERWADDWQRQHVLTRLVEGTWSGTMNLTEPDAGSDLGAVRTTATPLDGDRWAINGTKIFITWGEHDLTENIVHLVLARAPEAPPGTRGISVFVVPKYLLDEAGRPGERNGVHCRSIEHKLGIHASPTCVMEFVDAVGTLVGPLHGGMAAMFSMMNPARLGVGVQGVSIGERAYQQAWSYAQERRQGRADGVDGEAPIVAHPDVQRMLLDIAATRDACRLLTYATSAAGDVAASHPDPERRDWAQRRVDVLTPLAKAWSTDQGVRIASLAVQVHGGMGFVEETGIAQRYRDARIAPIYEGTNGIQAIDLVGRKVARDNGAAVGELLTEVDATVAAASGVDGLTDAAARLGAAVADVREATEWVVATFGTDREAVLAGATPYLELVSVCVAAHLLLRHAVTCAAGDPSTARRAARRAQFVAVHHLTQRPTIASIRFGEVALADGLD